MSHPSLSMPVDVNQIMQMLPHRYPFLLVDRVIDIEPNVKLRGLKNVSFNEPYFQGHFPGQPVMPGVLIIEAMAQASGLLTQLSQDPPGQKQTLFYLVKVNNARFTKPVVPGDQLILESRLSACCAAWACTSAVPMWMARSRQCRGPLRGAQHMSIAASASVHPTALIDPSAEIGANVSIGPFCVIGAHVRIGAGTTVAAHVVIEGPTTIGCDNQIHSFSVLGGDPQDKKFHGEHCELVIGDRNLIREFCTFNRGTADDGSVTRIGSDNWIMAYVHIAHDCLVGDRCVFANAASLAGHVKVGNQVILGGFSLVHQFCQVGDHAFTSMGSVINRDVPPFVTVAGQYAEPHGINSEGLRRRGFSSDRISGIKRAYRAIYKSGLPLAEAREKLAEMAVDLPDVKQMLDFIDNSQRSLVR